MAFNTAVFYDIENLLKGYSFSQQVVANLSLKEILESIRQTDRIGQVAVQRAYANWSDPRLAFMRNELNELGIDPIQVFGFSRDQKKNAADIQLAIDAIDLAHVRPSLEVFVIVSGDGGFASLAKKLHEYGKTVVGCAYRSAANRLLRAVSDGFVGINDPEEDERSERPVPASAGSSHPLVTDPRNVRLSGRIRRSTSFTRDTTLSKTREVLDWYASDSVCRRDLASGGIFLNVVLEGIRWAVPGFQSVRIGCPKFGEFMQFACRGTPLCVARPPNSQAVIALRSAVRNGVEVLPDLDQRELESPEGYRALLAAGSPSFRLPAPTELKSVVEWIVDHPPASADLGSIIESTVSGVNGLATAESVKLGLLSLISANTFTRSPENASLSEQVLTLSGHARSVESTLAALRQATQAKIQCVLGRVDDDLLAQLLTEPPAT